MEHELISVIVPIYNVENYLYRCLKSIAQQSYTNFEVILVDDGSSDKSGKICDDFVERDKRFRVIHQVNRGIPFTRNVGLDNVKGKYVSFIDSDDYIHPRMFEILHDAICESDYSCAVCKEEYVYDYASPREIDTYTSIEYTQHDVIKMMFQRGIKCAKWYYLWNKLFRSDYFKDLRFSNIAYEEDLDLNLRFYMLMNKLIYVDTALYYYMQRRDSITHLNGLKNTIVKIPARVDYIKYFEKANSEILKNKYISYFLPNFYRMLLQARYNAYGTEYETITEEKVQYALTMTYPIFNNNLYIPYLVKIKRKFDLAFPTYYRISRNMLNSVNSFFIYKYRDLKRYLSHKF